MPEGKRPALVELAVAPGALEVTAQAVAVLTGMDVTEVASALRNAAHRDALTRRIASLTPRKRRSVENKLRWFEMRYNQRSVDGPDEFWVRVGFTARELERLDLLRGQRSRTQFVRDMYLERVK